MTAGLPRKAIQMSGDSPTAIYVEKKSSGEFATPEKIF